MHCTCTCTCKVLSRGGGGGDQGMFPPQEDMFAPHGKILITQVLPGTYGVWGVKS